MQNKFRFYGLLWWISFSPSVESVWCVPAAEFEASSRCVRDELEMSREMPFGWFSLQIVFNDFWWSFQICIRLSSSGTNWFALITRLLYRLPVSLFAEEEEMLFFIDVCYFYPNQSSKISGGRAAKKRAAWLIEPPVLKWRTIPSVTHHSNTLIHTVCLANSYKSRRPTNQPEYGECQCVFDSAGGGGRHWLLNMAIIFDITSIYLNSESEWWYRNDWRERGNRQHRGSLERTS